MGLKQNLNCDNELLIQLTDEEVAILNRLRIDRNLTFSELIHEAIAYMEFLDGDPRVC